MLCIKQSLEIYNCEVATKSYELSVTWSSNCPENTREILLQGMPRPHWRKYLSGNSFLQTFSCKTCNYNYSSPMALHVNVHKSCARSGLKKMSLQLWTEDPHRFEILYPLFHVFSVVWDNFITCMSHCWYLAFTFN